MNLRELARLAGVSVSTVSKAFNDADDVSEKTKEFIFDIAKKYGCFGKYYKEKYSKRIIAIICPELRSNYYTNFIDRLKTLIEKNDGIVLISTDDFNGRKQAELIEYYASFLHVDGIFVHGYKGTAKQGYETPIISLSSSQDSSVNTVYTDLEPAVNQAVFHLQDLNHRNIAFIGEELTLGKEEHFRQAMDLYELDLPDNYAIRSQYRFEKAGEDGAEQLMKLPNPPSAIMCAYDYIAYGVISYLTRNGYKVPEDVSVIGMDNNDSSQHMDPPLTTIDFGYDEVCQIAWDLMCKKFDDKQYKMRQKIMVSSELILRESTAPKK